MISILITGTSRGLGLELVSQLLSLPPPPTTTTKTTTTIFATARASLPSPALSKVIDASHGRVHFVSLDVNSDASVTQAVREVESHLGPNQGLDILINNAGIQDQEGPTSQIKTENLERTFSTNVTSVHRVTSAILPHLMKGEQKKIVNITSTLGSIALVKQFAMAPTPSYKISKAALNMLTAQYAEELGPKGFTVFAVSPGWLKTDLGGSYADLEVADGASRVARIVMEAERERDNGCFRDIHVEGSEVYTGNNPPW